MMKDDDFKLLRGFADGRTDERTDICDCRVAFATENALTNSSLYYYSRFTIQMVECYLWTVTWLDGRI